MYKRFYGLVRDPFGSGPDPHFYFATPKHNEALATLLYGVQRRKGLIVLTGDVGTGKTLTVRYLMHALDRKKVRYAYVFYPQLSEVDFLAYVLEDFGLTVTDRTPAGMLHRLGDFLIELNRRGETAALLVDEAHALSQRLLESLRLLTNLETADGKLLQIVFAGQLELDDLLDSPEVRNVKQRVALRCKLLPLDDLGIRGYIERRLQVAGAGNRAAFIFPSPTIDRIMHYTRGVPRLINNICDAALVNGYARKEAMISVDTIEEVVSDLRLHVVTAPKEELTETQMLYRAVQRIAHLLEPAEGRKVQEVRYPHPAPAKGMPF